MEKIITRKYLDKSIEGLAKMVKKGFDGVDEKFEKVDKRFEKINEKFERIDGRFENVNARLDTIEQDLKEIKEEMMRSQDFEALELRVFLKSKHDREN